MGTNTARKTTTNVATVAAATDHEPTTGLSATVDQKVLASALRRLAAVAPKNGCYPAISNVCIRTDGKDALVLHATDLNLYLTIRVPSQNAALGGTLVNARQLLDTVKSFSKGSGAVYLRTTAQGLSITSGRSGTTLRGLPDRDFPKVPTHTGEWHATDGEILRSLIDRVSFSVCKDETRFHLNGALVEMDGERATLVSTDGHRLSKVSHDLRCPVLAKPRIVPLRALAELAKLADGKTALTMGTTGDPYLFACAGDATLVVKTIDAQFPPYEQVIPKDNSKLVTIDRAALLDACKRARKIACETRGTKVSLHGGVISLTTDDPDTGTQREQIDADHRVIGVFSIGVNPAYLCQTLEALDGDRVTLAIGKELDPIVIRVDGKAWHSLADAGFVGVIMPMRI